MQRIVLLWGSGHRCTHAPAVGLTPAYVDSTNLSWWVIKNEKKKIRGKYGHISMLTCMKFSKTCGKVDLKKWDSQPWMSRYEANVLPHCGAPDCRAWAVHLRLSSDFSQCPPSLCFSWLQRTWVSSEEKSQSCLHFISIVTVCKLIWMVI